MGGDRAGLNPIDGRVEDTRMKRLGGLLVVVGLAACGAEEAPVAAPADIVISGNETTSTTGGPEVTAAPTSTTTPTSTTAPAPEPDVEAADVDPIREAKGGSSTTLPDAAFESTALPHMADGGPVAGDGYTIAVPVGFVDADAFLTPELLEASFEGTELETLMAAFGDPALLENVDLMYVDSWTGNSVNVVRFVAPPADPTYVAELMAEQIGSMFGVEATGRVETVGDIDVAVIDYSLPSAFGPTWTRQYVPISSDGRGATITFSSPVGGWDPDLEAEVVASFTWS